MLSFVVLDSDYYQLVLTYVLLWAVLSLAWNILSGYAGYFSFGHAVFWGLGAYTVALGLLWFHLTPWVSIPLAAVVGAAAGALIGYPTFRLRGHYFALAMLAYPLAILYVFQWLGYQEIALPMERETPGLYMQFADRRVYVVLALALLVIALLISLWVENTRFGMALTAIKQNEPAAEAAGIDTWRWKMLALMLSGALGGGGRRALRRRHAGRDAGKRVRHAGLGAGADPGAVRRGRQPVGAGDRRAVLVPLAEGLNAELGDDTAGHSGRRVRRRDHRDHPAGAGGGLLAGARSAVAKADANRGAARRRLCAGTRRNPRGPAGAVPDAGDAPTRTAGVARCRHFVRRIARARRDRPRRAGRRAVRDHRPERRRQDDAVQRHQRVSEPGSRHDPVRRRADHRVASEPGVPARHRPHVSGRARLPAHDGP